MLISFRLGFFESCFLNLFLSLILRLIFSGRSMWCEFILPSGMLCLSAFSIRFVNVLFELCTSVGSVVSSSAVSISEVKFSQFAFL